jgi:hypothetical protein
MEAGIPWVQSPLNVFINVILICYYRSQLPEKTFEYTIRVQINDGPYSSYEKIKIKSFSHKIEYAIQVWWL